MLPVLGGGGVGGGGVGGVGWGGVSNKHCLLTFLVLDNESLLYSINIQTLMHIPGSCFRIYIK